MEDLRRYESIEELNNILLDEEKCQYYTPQELNEMEYKKRILERYI